MWWGLSEARALLGLGLPFSARRETSQGNFWAKGYFVSTVGLEEETVRAYIRHQESEDRRYEKSSLATDVAFRRRQLLSPFTG